MAAREHSRFVHFVLPWLIAAAGLVLYAITLNRWVGFSSVDLVSKVAGWDWNSMQLGPVTLLLTAPIRWMPTTLQPVGLNALSALLGAITLGVLAKCVALLPHDRTRDQRQRERSDFSFLTIPLAWIPPVAASGMLAVQMTFWEHSTAMTGETINLLLFALAVFCFLRFRILQQDGYLAALAFLAAAGAANDWGLVGFCPLFLVAVIWAKGIPFFDAGFLIRTSLAGLAGLLLYLIQPAALLWSGQADAGFIELVRIQLGIQRQYIALFPRPILLFCAVSSVLPIFVIGIRWPSSFGDLSAAGTAITNSLFRIIHLAFLGLCLWVMFDPPFSPRELGFGAPFLHFYFLSALAIGYLVGYLMLVFGHEPDRKIPTPPTALSGVGRLMAGLAAIAPFVACAGLAIRSFPTINAQNGPLVRDLASTLVTLPPGPKTLVSDDNSLLMLAMGLLTEQGRSKEIIPVLTTLLPRHIYQRHHERTYDSRWPALRIEELSDPLGDNIVLQQIVALGYTNRVYYLHPSFGYYFEPYHLVPTNTVYAFQFQPTNTYVLPPIPDAQFEDSHAQWDRIRTLVVENPILARMRDRKVNDTTAIGVHFSRALNTWGVYLQRRGRLEEAGTFFSAAMELNKDNIAAIINSRFNATLRAGRKDSVTLEKELNDQLDRYRGLPAFLSMCGPVDEPAFCYRLGRVFSEGNLNRQAAQQFARALELQPDNQDIRLWLANATLAAGLPDETVQVVESIKATAARLTPHQAADVASLEAWARFRKNDLPAAEALLLDAQKRFPDLIDPIQALADIYVAANQTNAALAMVEKVIERLPNDLRPVITKSAILMQSGALGEAVNTLNTVLEKDPGFFPALVNRALALYQMGRLEESEKDYRRLHEVAPRMNAVFYHLGEIDYQRGKATEARRNYQRFLETALPGSPEARAAQRRIDDIAAGKLGG